MNKRDTSVYSAYERQRPRPSHLPALAGVAKLKRPAKPAPLLHAPPDGAPGVMVPVQTKNPLNATRRGNWWAAASTAKHVRAMTFLACRGKLPTTRPATVTLTRYSPGECDDDGATAAMKPCRDGVADVFGCDDSRRSGLTFVYRQAKARGYGVLVSVENGR